MVSPLAWDLLTLIRKKKFQKIWPFKNSNKQALFEFGAGQILFTTKCIRRHENKNQGELRSCIVKRPHNGNLKGFV